MVSHEYAGPPDPLPPPPLSFGHPKHIFAFKGKTETNRKNVKIKTLEHDFMSIGLQLLNFLQYQIHY